MKLVKTDVLLDRSKILSTSPLKKGLISESWSGIWLPNSECGSRCANRGERRGKNGLWHGRVRKGTLLCHLPQRFDLVSVKMAKEQNLALNPSKISGVCGRLMCCLSYEFSTYLELKKNLPKVGKHVVTRSGKGKVIRQNVLNQTVTVELEQGGEVTVHASTSNKIFYVTTRFTTSTMSLILDTPIRRWQQMFWPVTSACRDIECSSLRDG